MRHSFLPGRRYHGCCWTAGEEVRSGCGRTVPCFSRNLPRQCDLGGEAREREEGAKRDAWSGAWPRCRGSRRRRRIDGKHWPAFICANRLVALARALSVVRLAGRRRTLVCEFLRLVAFARAPSPDLRIYAPKAASRPSFAALKPLPKFIRI